MKFFKSSIFSFVALGAMVTFTGCSDDKDDYSLVDAGSLEDIYFPTVDESTIQLERDGSTFNVEVSRLNAEGAVTATIIAEQPLDIFTVPGNVSFAAGEKNATLTIGYDVAKMALDQNYHLTLKIGGEAADAEFGKTVYDMTLVVPAAYIPVGDAQYKSLAWYRDGFISSTIGSTDTDPYQVEIQENEERPGVYRLVNPYGPAYPLYKSGGFKYEDKGNFYMVINAQDPEFVYLETFNTSLSFGTYGEIWVNSTVADLIPDYGTEFLKRQGWGGTFDKEAGLITIPASYPGANSNCGYNVCMGSSWYGLGNENGRFAIAFPGHEITDYSISISPLGYYIDGSEGVYYLECDVTLGADVNSGKIVAVPGKVAEEDLDMYVDMINTGDIAATEITEDGTYRLRLSRGPSADYTVFGLSYNREGEVKSSDIFYF